MTGIWMYVWLLVGFVCLIKGADFFVEGSSSVAKIFKVPTVIIGLTIVAMGTSAPETAVSISAALKGANEIAVSNVVGSNFFNLLGVVGICALMQPVSVTKDLIKRDFPVAIIAAVLLLAFLVIGASDPTLGIVSGIILLASFALYIGILIKSTLDKNKRGEVENTDNIKSRSLPVCILLITVGLAGVVVGGDLVVDSASAVAADFGMSNTLIGLTIVAVGTSLPELVTSIVAAGKGEADLALGNIIGSNIYNILFVLGMSSVLNNITVPFDSVVDTALLIVVHAVVLGIVCKMKSSIGKGVGIVMILMYVVYTVYIIMRSYGIMF